ncbi:MAG: 4Fe-4S dicluster domain-containing protein [Bdellovibrionota bacterium]
MDENIKFNRRKFFTFAKDNRQGALAAMSKEVLGSTYKREHLRPPGAIPEPEFLVTCTRCGYCAEACPYGSIELIENNENSLKDNTPTINVFDTPCHYCQDTPCVTACEPGALNKKAIGGMGKAKFKQEHCLVTQGQYCDYCFNSCPATIKAITKTDAKIPEIDQDKCIGCGKCAYICVSQTGKAIIIEPS